MSIKTLRKDELRILAEELGLNPPADSKIIELKKMIEESDVYRDQIEYVQTMIFNIVEDKKSRAEKDKSDNEIKLQLEKIKLTQLEKEIELANLRGKESSINVDESKSDKTESLDSLVKSVRVLSVKVPTKSEDWGHFFVSLERAFELKAVPKSYQAEILLILLGERANNILTYVQSDEISDYEKLKYIVLKQYEPTPQSCLENFRKAVRQSNESHTQFAARLTTAWEYYLKLRKVENFVELKQLIVSDKLFSTLDRETSMHISIKQGEDWLSPTEMAQSCDVFFHSKNKTLSEAPNNFKGFRPTQRGANVRSFFLGNKTSGNKNFRCVLCKGDAHNLSRCPIYEKKSVPERLEVVKENNFCFNCLGKHSVKNCTSKFSCQECRKRHHVTLHFPREKSLAAASIPEVQTEIMTNSQVQDSRLNSDARRFEMSSNCYQINNSEFIGSSITDSQAVSRVVLLSTAIIYVKDTWGNFIACRALLDSGSQCSAFNCKFANKLGIKKKKINVAISGLNGMALSVKSKLTAVISNKHDYNRALEFFVVPKINDMVPVNYFNFSFTQLPQNIKLADPHFNKPQEIDALLGVECFYELLKADQIHLQNPRLTFQNSVFGYIASGTIFGSNSENTIHCGLMKVEDLNSLIKSFWELEAVGESVTLKNKEELECEDHFVKTHSRDKEGRYVVTLPIRQEVQLGDSLQLATQRLNNLWRRLDRNPDMSKMYCEFMSEYEALGHMQQMQTAAKVPRYIMPHHGVYRADSSTTKLRVVFDASAPSSSGFSLNDCLMNGGVVQDDLFSILLRFRNHKVAFTADIRKMYRQIRVNPDQCHLQCVIWKNALNDPSKLYELLTVTYGTKSAPYLATRVLRQLAIDEKDNYPLASETTLSDFYVDDILSGAKDVTSAAELQQQLIAMLKSANMELHKWCSNERSLLEQVPFEYQEYHFEEPSQGSVKTLGLRWNPEKDSFSFTMSGASNTCTKRSVLAEIAKLFDPLGFLGPVIMRAKIFLQRLWLLQLDWDDPLPSKEQQEWKAFQSALPELRQIQVPRYTLINSMKKIELHCFADASKVGYGGVIYLRCVSESGEVKVTLLCSKSRISPLKVITIPRLELCAAELLSKLVSKVMTSVRLNIDNIVLYTDSTIVLAWINTSPHLLKVFVSNRVARIQELTNTFSWQHVRTEDNPADLISRGVSPEHIVDNFLWFQGPNFLHQQFINYHSVNKNVERSNEDYVRELKNCDSKILDCFNITVNSFIDDLLKSCSKYLKLIRVISFVYRFIHNCRAGQKKSGPLDSEEFQRSETYLIRYIQSVEFHKEIRDLQGSGMVSKDSKIKTLHPYLDEDGVLRVGGRLTNSDLSFNSKFPMLLPTNHKVTNLIAEFYHKRNLHAGPQALLHEIRQKFWPLSGRSLCRKIVHECIVCFRSKPIVTSQLMGNLPRDRIVRDYPFNCSGADFCGPFLIKYPGQRKGTLHKIFVCIFVCFSTKCIHIEIVTDLTSAALIATLKRFFARRGKSAKIYSDNGKNFVGANAEIKKLLSVVLKQDSELSAYLSSEGIEWKFIPPRAPSFGGLWEAAVRSFKYHFKRVVGGLNLTYEEFLTVSVQIEGVLNSRPLCPLSNDVDDLNALTPAHFIIGRSMSTVIEPSLTDLNENCLKKWQRVTRVVQLIWKKWSQVYLSGLQQRNKWYFEKDNVKVGDLVILTEENMPTYKWPLGRVVKLYRGDDNLVRVVLVKTKKGVFKRPITKLCILPFQVINRVKF